MIEFAIIQVTNNATYNYFFSLVFIPGVAFIPALYVLRILKFS